MATLIIKEAVQVLPATHGGRASKLAAYIDDPAKCSATQCANFPDSAPDAKSADAAREMAALCYAADHGQQGKRKLVQHWILSWKLEDGEPKPSDAEMYAAAGEAMEAIGFGRCPRIMGIHTNTQHPHVHVAVARVDPQEGRIVRYAQTHVKAQRAVAEITARHGWATERGHWYRYRDGQIVRATKEERSKRGGIRTRTIADEMQRVKGHSAERDLAGYLADFCAANRQHFGAWKWADLHRALALAGIEMQYTDRGNGRGGLAFSADGRTWKKASQVCPELTYTEISRALGAKAGSYRKARQNIAAIVAEARANRPALSCPEPQDVEQAQAPRPEAAQAQPPRQEAAQTQGAPRAPREERKEMTDAQLQYLALLARERADERTRKTLDAMNKAANIDFYRQNEAILQKLHESKYTDADAYARLKYNAARYHLRRVAMDAASQRRDEDETRRNRRQYATFRAHAKRHATAGQDPRRIAAIMMYRAGAKVGKIAALMVDGMLAEAEAEKSNYQQICDQIEDIIADTMDAMIADMLRDRTPAEKLDAEIAKIEDAYADMSLHAPAEYREGMEERKQEAIAAARALHYLRLEAEAEAAREEEEKPTPPPPTPTAADARIFARHAAQAEKTAPSEEKTKEMIALRLRACGHSADDAVRIMCAGMGADAAAAAVASMYHTPHGDAMMRIARDCAAQWHREEQGQDTIRRNGGATQAQRPAAAAAPKPRM